MTLDILNWYRRTELSERANEEEPCPPLRTLRTSENSLREKLTRSWISVSVRSARAFLPRVASAGPGNKRHSQLQRTINEVDATRFIEQTPYPSDRLAPGNFAWCPHPLHPQHRNRHVRPL